MNRQRLLDTIETLEGIEPESFDMQRWSSTCGTVGCAVGHHAQTAKAQAEGLRIGLSQPFYEHEGVVYSSWDAVKAYYSLDDDDAHRLFCSTRYNSVEVIPSDVIRRIEKFLGESNDC